MNTYFNQNFTNAIEANQFSVIENSVSMMTVETLLNSFVNSVEDGHDKAAMIILNYLVTTHYSTEYVFMNFDVLNELFATSSEFGFSEGVQYLLNNKFYNALNKYAALNVATEEMLELISSHIAKLEAVELENEVEEVALVARSTRRRM